VDALRRRAGITLFAVAGATFLVDRVTKVWAERELAGRPVDVIRGVLTLRFTTNRGGAFSLFQDAPLFFAVVSIVVVAAILATSFRHTDQLAAAALGLVLGGALGNLTDRVVRGTGLSGEVVDFIDLHVWPVFNLADAAIVVGALLLAFGAWRRDHAAKPADATDAR
jgi:signal peptidase II